MGDRSSPLPFWIPVLVFSPSGPQRRERLGPGVAVGVGVRGVARALPVSGIYPLDLDSVGVMDGVAAGRV
jgi:hypothetical protein